MWIMPTMCRPDQASEVLNRIIEIGCSTSGIVLVNGFSDEKEYRELLTLPKDWGVIYSAENIGCIGALNLAYSLFPNEPWYGFIGDDEFLLEAPADWDLRLIEKAGTWDIAHGWEDLNNGSRCQGYPVISGDLVRSIGYLAIPECFHNYGFDSMYEFLSGVALFGGGACVDIHCLSEIKINHRHVIRERCENDLCYQLANSHCQNDHDSFMEWVKYKMPVIVQRVNELKSL